MKKLFFAFLFCIFFVSFLQAKDISGFGFSLKAGAISSDTNFKPLTDAFSKSAEDFGLEQYFENDDNQQVIAGFNLFYEQKGLFGFDKKHSFGASVEYSFYPKSQYEIGYHLMEFYDYDQQPGIDGQHYVQEDMSLKSEAYAIPVNVYYKYALGEKFKVSASLGVTFLHNEFAISSKGKIEDIDYNDSSNSYSNYGGSSFEKSQNIIMPSIGAGAEFSISRYVGLFADIGWQLNGKVKWSPGDTSKALERDFSGFLFNIVIKIYHFAFTQEE
ncbi:MAG: hypothetical protein LBO62_02195 [Endomicrobium sp.]|jgi:opacity protein-like surface antigen|nr:hypothetical protein [Endomicrobium sp.]